MITSAARQPKRSSSLNKPICHGYSLIEVVVVISLSSFLTGIVAVAMASLLGLDRNITQHVEDRTELQQLAVSIRSDVHQATDFQWDAAEQTFKLELPGPQSIRYQIIGGRWMRFVEQEGDSTIRTAYQLSESFQCYCEPTTGTRGARVRIKFNSILDGADDQDGQAKPALQCEIISTIGRDYDLLSK